ncbi:anaphase-promoting complex, cyclosome, subunit 4-domain-containing protein [Phycomyces nitens]|nr:anaphase-promoting complex, cyclosome, subunit 4-domain-containing protein [Phycomyces nitens]
MNLAAIVLKDNSLILYRISGEIVWSEESSKDGIVGIAWRPDGQELVVAYQSGKVMKTGIAFPKPTWVSCTFPTLSTYLTENIQSKIGNNGIISCISWTEYEIENAVISDFKQHGFDPNAIQVKKHLPTLCSIAPDGPILGGMFYTGTINVEEILGKDTSVEDIDLSPDMGAMTVQVKQQVHKRKVPGEDEAGVYHSLSLVPALLKRNRSELYNIANIHVHINNLLDYTSHAIKKLESHYKTHASVTERHLDRLIGSMKEEYTTNSIQPSTEMQTMLATGYATPALKQYFFEELTEQDVMRWSTTLNHSYKTLIQIVVEYILPANDYLVASLSDLYGVEKSGRLLDRQKIKECSALCGCLTAQMNVFVSKVATLSSQFEAFMEWILTAVRQATDQKETNEDHYLSVRSNKPRLVRDYLKMSLTEDSLKEYFLRGI